MKTADKTEKLMRDVLKEMRGLRRDVSLIIPTESIDEYKNKVEILAAYRAAKRSYPRGK